MAKEVINIDAIARDLASANNITIKLAKTLVKNTLGIIANNLDVDKEVYLKDFGIFKVNPRKCQVPNTTKVITTNVISFKAFKNIKAKVK